MRLCTECKWSTDLGDTVRHPAHLWACGNDEVGSYLDVVDGKRVYKQCSMARGTKEDYDLPCGHVGKLWEKR